MPETKNVNTLSKQPDDPSAPKTDSAHHFIAMALLECAAVILLTALLIWLIRPRAAVLFDDQLRFFDIVLLSVGTVLPLAMLLLIIGWIGGIRLLPGAAARRLTAVMMPGVFLLGVVCRQSKDRLRREYVHINNRMVRARPFHLAPEDILILLPHCLQWSGCPVRITADLSNCQLCGRCFMAYLLRHHHDQLERIKVATGGTLARRHIRELRPQAVVAVACERDLMSGIVDSQPLPVLGVLLNRPNGPCVDTEIAEPEFEAALRHFLGSIDTPARANSS